MATIKNLVNFAAKFFDMAKAKVKDKKKVAPKAKSKPAAKKVAKPAKKVVAAKAKKVVKPAAKAKAKPVAKKPVKAKPVVKKKAAPKPKAKVVKKAAKPAPKPKAKVITKPAKVNKPVAAKAKPVAKAVAKPAPKVVVKPSPKVVAKPEAKVAFKKNQDGSKTAAGSVAQQAKHDANNVAKPLYKTNMKKPEPITKELNLCYSDEELKEFKTLIEKKLVSAREELKNLKESLDNHTESQAGNKAWNMEEGTDTSEMEYLMNQISRLHQYIRNLELALVRVENKTYGICRVSGKLIAKERLRMVPHATLSIEAKQQRKTDDTSPGASIAAPPSDFSEGFED
ncbi:MAG: TraR/DksA family transcriptional regulator [Bacteroidota bacterium]|nr:TraR/DksA family transcriptional regulator [Bacteroidota bacterium]